MSTLTLQPDGTDGVDAYISSAGGDNTGTADTLQSGTLFFGGNSSYLRSLLRFDITSIPSDAAITAATLTLTKAGAVFNSVPQTFGCYRLTQTAWTEGGVTWGTYDGSSTWSVGGEYTTALGDELVVSSTASDLVFDGLADLARDASDNRSGLLNVIVIGPEVAGASNYHQSASSDHATASVRPQLVVTYTQYTGAEAQWGARRGVVDWTVED